MHVNLSQHHLCKPTIVGGNFYYTSMYNIYHVLVYAVYLVYICITKYVEKITKRLKWIGKSKKNQIW